MSAITVTNALLERACSRSGFPIPQDELVLFGIRGALPEGSAGTGFSNSHVLRFTPVDYRSMRCCLGQWNRADRTIAVYPGSTVPSLPNIARAKENGGAGTNLLLPGRYEYIADMHKPNKSSGHRAFRQACFFPVRRTRDNTSYDAFDTIDFAADSGTFVWDNLHSAYSDTRDRYSSAGCQVVCGLPMSADRNNKPETGPWRDFIHVAYNQFGHQKRFTYLLFTAEELSVIATSTDLRKIVRYGSVGETATLVQQALIATGDLEPEADGKFGRKSLMALVAFQGRTFPRAGVDGECGLNTASALGIVMPPVEGLPDPAGSSFAETATVPEDDIDDETDMSETEIARLLGLLGVGQARPTGIAPLGSASVAAQGTRFRLDLFMRGLRDLFPADPDPEQREGMALVIKAFFRRYPEGDPRWLAYILATIFHETGKRMVPVREGFAGSDAAARAVVARLFKAGKIRRDYALPDPQTGISYFGRGRIQTTHRENYEKLSRRFDQDFVNKPELLLDPAIDAEVAAVGLVEGLWTRWKLHDFIAGSRCNYREARRIVNGLDKADDIARFARHFEAAVLGALETGRQATTITGRDVALGQSNGRDRPMRDEGFAAILEKLRQLDARIPGNADTPAGAATPADDAAPVDDRLERLLKLALSRTDPTLPVTPVNAALGQGVGRLLDGKKTVIGVAGALIASIAQNGGSNVDSIVAAVNQAAPFLAGLSGTSLPIFVAIAFWGMLGKVEKMILRSRLR